MTHKAPKPYSQSEALIPVIAVLLLLILLIIAVAFIVHRVY